jgi:hypothetical protein
MRTIGWMWTTRSAEEQAKQDRFEATIIQGEAM